MKAILVIEMPKSCRECGLRTTLEANKFHCMAILPRKEIKPYEEQKPSWCPLKPMPNEISTKKITGDDQASLMERCYIYGWNACLEALEDSQNGEDSNE